ncbi:hypothetical protein ZOSMA_135G00600 [Zostera marina]|uniref:Uncharacterized protein n=1 Tax=Zostera marina TaxID=29655 RepID=A0A0K9Q122_ZOSMR|nr:hypothetical protein ZOSMA_135G00600 [Zostera marina]
MRTDRCNGHFLDDGRMSIHRFTPPLPSVPSSNFVVRGSGTNPFAVHSRPFQFRSRRPIAELQFRSRRPIAELQSPIGDPSRNSSLRLRTPIAELQFRSRRPIAELQSPIGDPSRRPFTGDGVGLYTAIGQ